ncbi:hypothetical protein K3495_g10885 [Podosphaera aphanis]|nr:hypothetical protein K3495_g10885 [Podosphaera aphanis]
MKFSSNLTEAHTKPNLDSSTELLFPTLTTHTKLDHIVEDTKNKAMIPRSEDSSNERSLSESAYEFIETDDEGRDDNTTESIASTEFFRSDDFTSVEGTECSVEDSEEEVLHGSHHSVLLDQTVEEAFNAPTISCTTHELMDDIDQIIPKSIEFEEPLNIDSEPICVKYTIAHLNEDQRENLLQGSSVGSNSKTLKITIRQTMIKRGLSTKEPLRILYVGSHSAKQDIIHKIASSVTASVGSETRAQNLHYSTSQLYNVVPISAFGSEKTPEIELMHSSGYQIKVDDCHFAQSLKSENHKGNLDTIKLFLDDQFTCRSIPSGDGRFNIEPSWELPHIAVFHFSNSDNNDLRQTTALTKNFMSRHQVPSIVISHKMMFDQAQSISLDENSLHMCLETDDLNGKDSIIHQRLPIDLASFLNIDARQMNRNLAYLTGLHEPLDSSDEFITKEKSDLTSKIKTQDQENTSFFWKDGIKLFWNQSFHLLRSFLSKVFLFLLFFVVLRGYASYKAASVPAISINSKIVSAASISSSPTRPVFFSFTGSPIPSTSTAIKISTQTTTVTNYLSLASIFVTEKFSEEDKKAEAYSEALSSTKHFSCTAELYREKNILIRIPAVNKATWFNNEVISVNITRANATIDTEEAYSSSEGIVLSLPRKEAYGIVNVTIITTQKPRITETFILDFGSMTSQALQNLKNRISAFILNNSNFDASHLAQIRKETSKFAGDTLSKFPSAISGISGLGNQAKDQAARVADKLTNVAQSLSIITLKHSSILSEVVAAQATEAQKVLYRIEKPIFSARVHSKILWLKFQGRNGEANIYRDKATAAVRTRRRTRQGRQ